MSVAQNVVRGITWRFALRETRGGLRGFAVFIACIALGVAAIAGVGSFARSLSDGLAREGRAILGGDVAFSLIAREASAAERTFLDDNSRAQSRRPGKHARQAFNPANQVVAPAEKSGLGSHEKNRWPLRPGELPYVLAVHFSRLSSDLAVALLPFEVGGFDVKQHWHRRYHNDTRNKWIRSKVAQLFTGDSDQWEDDFR